MIAMGLLNVRVVSVCGVCSVGLAFASELLVNDGSVPCDFSVAMGGWIEGSVLVDGAHAVCMAINKYTKAVIGYEICWLRAVTLYIIV